MHARKIARAYLIAVGIWCSLSLLTGWQYHVFDESLNIHSSLLDMIILGEARGFSFALLTPPIFYFVWRHIGAAGHLIRYSAACALGVVPFVAIYACIHWILIPPWDPVLQRYVSRAGHSPIELVQSGFADQITIYIAIVVAAHAYVYFERARKQELERYEYQQALAAAELQALRMQLHPHFLFNTLHGISTLIDQEPVRAKKMIVKLSGLLRTALGRGGSDLISLREELKFVGEYLDLEKMRLGPKLTVRLRIDPGTEQLLVPQLILQPLVENAIRHGIACSREQGWLEIESHRTNGSFNLMVRNSVGDRRPTPAGAGVGLRNTETRLKYLYADEAMLSFAREEGTATTTIAMPALGVDSSNVEGRLSEEEAREAGGSCAS